jgi:UV DNA damage repair endonuclease
VKQKVQMNNHTHSQLRLLYQQVTGKLLESLVLENDSVACSHKHVNPLDYIDVPTTSKGILLREEYEMFS